MIVLYLADENITLTNNNHMIKLLSQTHYQCQTSNKYIHQSLVRNHHCDCGDFQLGECEEEYQSGTLLNKTISFQYICDGFVDILSNPCRWKKRNR